MKLKIFKKLFFTTSCVLFITLTLVFVLMSIVVNDEFSKNKYSVLTSSCESLSDVFKEEGKVLSDQSITLTNALSKVNNLDIYVADSHGRIVLCSCDDFSNGTNCVHSNTILHQDFLNSISFDRDVELSSVDGMYDRLNYATFKQLTLGSQGRFLIIAVSDVMSATDLISLMFGMYAISAIIPLIFMFVAEYSLVYRITRPLKYMSMAAQSISQGDFSRRVPIMSNDEIGELSVLFNRMTESLSRTENTAKSFVANVSHELKTPMTTISGFIDGIIDNTIDEDKREHYLRIVSSEVKRLSRLVQSMLSLAKLESGDNNVKFEELRFSEIVLNVVVSMEQNIIEKNIEISGLDSLTETVVEGDRDLLHQVVYNLTDNAVKFTPVNGEISFNLRRIGDWLEFRLRNSGEGIPEQDIPHVFEKFYKIDKSRSNHKDSLGLGLFICKTIIELHGGEISVNSIRGEFTEFTVKIPIENSKRRRK